MLRAGGYFVWAAQPVYKHETKLQEQWKGKYLIQHWTNLQHMFINSYSNIYHMLT